MAQSQISILIALASLAVAYRIFLFSAEWSESNGLHITPSILSAQ